MKLSKNTVLQIGNLGPEVPPWANFGLPEKIIQFGTGVLLRGLVDYFIDKANKAGQFNGRVVVVKSTDQGEGYAFGQQDNLFTHCIRGIDAGATIERNLINASISRVLSAKHQWQEILRCAADPAFVLVVSNTTEVGLTLTRDDVHANPPETYPGKLLSFLWHRFQALGQGQAPGLVIIPTELIPNNGELLLDILQKLASQNNLSTLFSQWLGRANFFCSSLVDRIVPGKPPKEKHRAIETDLGYEDQLLIISEYYRLWAIETSSEEVKRVLSFSEADEGVVIASDISTFRELKLRLLNGSHTFCCGLAFLAGFATVREAMADKGFRRFIEQLMKEEIIPVMTGADITKDRALRFADQVLDRFRNPFLEHPWINITLQFSSKMRMRNLPLIRRHAEIEGQIPDCMCWGFAAYILFMRGEKSVDGNFYGRLGNGTYRIQDDEADWYARTWKEHPTAQGIVGAVLSRSSFWETDLTAIPGFALALQAKLELLMNVGAGIAIRDRTPV